MQDLIDLAMARGLRVVWRNLGRRRGEYRHRHGLIVVNQTLSVAQQRATMAHELGHAAYGDEAVDAALERRATTYAARLLISPVEYAAAERLVGSHAGALARELGVTREIVLAWQERRRVNFIPTQRAPS
ncbi:ImmA/IrrE family metallo-endopeptidase [Cellulomonas cellasea]|uniref:ImmA/IrrE family metallo-endopeptidase n=1 Tax=Cellulomonas cellasea TaxID=43670 RepID=UPI0025A43367|nr:ImmA/IrrE family metallo-endopeptidase [Cellulomonas cellasea]MDM8086310.1 ImmA/IrrE family metallo-endopeptidase [Cellulomonas cellasea]